MELNEDKLQNLLGTVETEMEAAANGPLVTIEDKHGLYTTLTESGYLTSHELAAKTNTAERYVREWLSAQVALRPDGTCMIVEPFAKDTLEDNLNPVGRAFYAFSTMLCVPCSLNQEMGKAIRSTVG